MKQFLLIISILLISLVGCTDNSESLLDPNVDNYTLEKSTSFSHTPDSYMSDYELIPLPPKAFEWQDSVFSVSQTVNGTLGGTILLDKFYVSSEGQIISILATLVIPPGAFEGNKTITATIDDEYAAVHFFPSMTFERPLKLTQSFSGLDLTDFSTGTIDFVFIDDNGTVETISKNGIQVILPQGLVRVLNAKISHFSRYAFSRRPERRIVPETCITTE